jgi:hypothetical protein
LSNDRELWPIRLAALEEAEILELTSPFEYRPFWELGVTSNPQVCTFEQFLRSNLPIFLGPRKSYLLRKIDSVWTEGYIESQGKFLPRMTRNKLNKDKVTLIDHTKFSFSIGEPRKLSRRGREMECASVIELDSENSLVITCSTID